MRKYEIDSLRVFAFSLLIFYHIGMFFVPWDWHIKNNDTPSLTIPMLFLNQWRLPLLFLISGMGNSFSMNKRTPLGFLFERFIRLLIPLIFGMLVIVPPQVYVERMIDGATYTSYLEFFLTDARKGGNISWHHLWFLAYLFFFSLLFVPLAQAWRPISRSLKKINFSVPSYLFIILACIPTFLCEWLLRPIFPVTHSFGDDWYTYGSFFWMLICGYVFASLSDKFWSLFDRIKYHAFFIGVIAFVLLYIPGFKGYDIPKAALRAVNMWSWILFLLGIAIRFWNKPNRWLSYANEAVYPFYILHQTVIVVIGYYLYNSPINVAVKFCVMLVGTFATCFIAYELLIRRILILRPLFGLKIKRQSNFKSKPESGKNITFST